MRSLETVEGWCRFLFSPSAPNTPISALELDGYLTGIIVAPQPNPIPPSAWLPGLLEPDPSIFSDVEQKSIARAAVMAYYDAIVVDIDRSLVRLDAEGVSDYRPLFLGDHGKPFHQDVRCWVRGFTTAMSLAPDAWVALAEDQRTEVLVFLFVGFLDIDETAFFEKFKDAGALLDSHAALIPRAIAVLYKIAKVLRERVE